MNITTASPPNSSLSALRGAVGEVVGDGDPRGCWGRVVLLWRIFRALDGLMALLWDIVQRIGAGEIKLDGCSAADVAVMPVPLVVVAGAGLERRGLALRPAVRLGSPVLAAAEMPALWREAGDCGRSTAGRWVLPGAGGWLGRELVGEPAGFGGRCLPVLELGWGGLENCVLIVPVQ